MIAVDIGERTPLRCIGHTTHDPMRIVNHSVKGRPATTVGAGASDNEMITEVVMGRRTDSCSDLLRLVQFSW